MIHKLFKTAYDIFPIFNRPMAVCATISFIAIFVLYFNRDVSLSLLLLFSIISLAFCILTRNKKIIIISILFLAVLASAVNEFMTISDLEALDNQVFDADFVAVEDSYNTGKVSKVTAYCTKSDKIPNKTKFSFYYFTDDKIMCGDNFNATVKLSSLEGSEYKSYNFGNSIYMDCKLIKINSRYEANAFFLKIGNARRYIISTLSSRFDRDISGILIALNCGDKRFLSDDFYTKVLVCGVSHIMAVSGLHISIIIGALFVFFEKFYYNRYLKSIISFVVIFSICAVCGFTLSAVRSGVMFIFFVLSPILRRKNDALNSLGSAVILILFFSPLSILSVGFQLSVAATLSVVWIAPFYCKLITEKLYIKNSFARKVLMVFVVSVCALIFTAPISMLVFDTYAVLSPVTFLLITFPVTVALEFNTAALIISAVNIFSFIANPLFFVSGLCTKYIKFIIDNLGVLDFLLVKADVLSFVIFIFLIIFLILSMYLYKYYQKLVKRRFLSEVNCSGSRI